MVIAGKAEKSQNSECLEHRALMDIFVYVVLNSMEL